MVNLQRFIQTGLNLNLLNLLNLEEKYEKNK